MTLNILYWLAGPIRTDHRRTGGVLGRYGETMSSALQRVVWRSFDKDCYCTLRQLISHSAGCLYKGTCISVCLLLRRSYSSFVTVTRSQAWKQRIGFCSRQWQRCIPVNTAFRPALGYTQPSCCVHQTACAVLERPGRDTSHTFLSSSEAQNDPRYIFYSRCTSA